MRARGAGGARARASAASAGEDDARCEVFAHPVYGQAVRARVAVPARTMLLEEQPLLYGKPPARLEAVCDEVRGPRKACDLPSKRGALGAGYTRPHRCD